STETRLTAKKSRPIAQIFSIAFFGPATASAIRTAIAIAADIGGQQRFAPPQALHAYFIRLASNYTIKRSLSSSDYHVCALHHRRRIRLFHDKYTFRDAEPLRVCPKGLGNCTRSLHEQCCIA